MFGSGFVLVTFLLAAPGVLALQVIEWLAPIKKESAKNKVVTSFVLALLIYLTYLWIASWGWEGIQPINAQIAGTTIGLQNDISLPFYNVNGLSILLVLGISIAFGIFFAWTIDNGWFLALLSKAHISYSTGRANVWQDIFRITHGSWAQVILKDGTTILGHISHYSDDPGKPMLFFSRVEEDKKRGIETDQLVEIWRPGTEAPKKITGPGLLLVTTDIECIEFRDPATNSS